VTNARPCGLALWALAAAVAAGCVDERCFADRDCIAPRICDRDEGAPDFGRCVLQCSAASDCQPAYECLGHRCLPAMPPDAAAGDAPAPDAPPDDAAPGDAGADAPAGDDGGPGACPADMAPGGEGFCIDVYEASRPDATATTQGSAADRATSRPGVLPWQPVTLGTARAACAAAGKRLCRPEEWVAACAGPSGTAYSYGPTYSPTTCNGIDTFCSCGAGSACAGASPCPFPHCYGTCGASFHVAPTGSFPGCVSAGGLFDVTGNVWELVDSSDGLEHFRGGAYNCSDSEALHRCDYDATWGPSARGFRCCADR
jgi:hypothetical protein